METAQHSITKTARQITTKSDIKKAKLVELWGQTKGHISDMCRAVGVTRQTFYTWLKEDSQFNQDIQNAEWDLNDDVRDALIQKIADGSSTDIQFYLKKRHPDFKDKPSIVQQFNVGGEMGVEFIEDDQDKTV